MCAQVELVDYSVCWGDVSGLQCVLRWSDWTSVCYGDVSGLQCVLG